MRRFETLNITELSLQRKIACHSLLEQFSIENLPQEKVKECQLIQLQLKSLVVTSQNEDEFYTLSISSSLSILSNS